MEKVVLLRADSAGARLDLFIVQKLPQLSRSFIQKLIEDGHITEPIRDANLIGNGPEVLSKVDAVGSDFDMSPGTCGKDGQSVPVGCGQPTLRITGVTIGGTAGD